MNHVFRDLIVSRIESAIREARAAAAVSHPGLKGRIREILIRDLFRPLLPVGVGIGCGQILSIDGRVSTEQDLVIYDSRLLPPIIYEASTGLFPIEGCLATIEIKSRLTREELIDAEQKAALLHDFPYQSGVRADTAGDAALFVERVLSCVFALDSDLAATGMSEFERYQSLDGRHPEALRALCVVGRGYWFRRSTGWIRLPTSFDYAEVVAFVVGTLAALGRVAATRRSPELVDYVFESTEVPTLE